jgi:hypothetical protein
MSTPIANTRTELGSLLEFSENRTASRTASAILTINSPEPVGRTLSRAVGGRTLSCVPATTLNATQGGPVKAHGDFVPASSLPLTPVKASGGGAGAVMVPVCTPDSSSRMDPLKLEAPGAPTKKPKRDASSSSDEYEYCAEEGYGGRTLSRVVRRRRLTSEDLKTDEAMPTQQEIDDYVPVPAPEDKETTPLATQEHVPDSDPEPATQEYVLDSDPEPAVTQENVAGSAGDAMDVARAG